MNSISYTTVDIETDESNILYNHVCATLSGLDMEMVVSVPAGGNWQDIPMHIIQKSARLTQISKSGGRTTYYGRLTNHLPSYTINTYFNRPGNGTFIHPEQNRLISQREAARLQSFPDQFHFLGSISSRYKQIGNAVPPLLARSIATLLKPGLVVDLFSGAGGLSEGFVQAGHDVILATDFNPNMCKTYSYNHQTTEMVQADLSLQSQMDKLQERIEQRLAGRHLGTLIGGPPCQGFSTAGNRNTADRRNSLIFRMLELVQILMPESVVIENVPGLKWMQKGTILESIVDTLTHLGYSVNVHNLKAEEYGVPQRRRRIFVIGSRNGDHGDAPEGLFAPLIRGKARTDVRTGNKTLPHPVSVSDAISDLPPIESGGGEEIIEYCIDWTESDYQRLMRNSLSFDDFITKRREQG